MKSLKSMKEALSTLIRAYGAFFLLEHPLSNILLVLCTMLSTCTHLGFMGLLGGVSTIAFRSVLRFPPLAHDIEVVNGILVGLMIGASYSCDARSIMVTIISGLLVVIVSALLNDSSGRWLRLPLLGSPYVLVSYLIISVAGVLKLSPLALAPLSTSAPATVLSAIGAFYFNPTALGGILVLAAIAVSSPYLFMLSLASALSGTFVLGLMEISQTNALHMLALMNAVLTAIILGGLFARPGAKSFIVAMAASTLALPVTVSVSTILWGLGLPALASPFLVTVYAALAALSAERGRFWSGFWLRLPTLPERSLELYKLSSSRGVDEESLALKAPVSGTWQIYQGFFGPHTHQSPWQYSLDFFKTIDGKSHSDSGTELSDYYCFAAPVLSPVFGVVVAMESGLADNPPSQMDLANVWGNYILIRLDCGAYLKLAHLKQDSIRVELLSRVVPGQTLALCGNTGRSPQPHLHMHVQKEMAVTSSTLPFHLTSVVKRDAGSDNEPLYTLNFRPEENESFSTPQINTALKKGLNLPIGGKLDFDVVEGIGRSSKRSLSVEVDLSGQFSLVSDRGARACFTSNDELIAFYNRTGPDDVFFDCFLLSYGVTPFLDGHVSWMDAPPFRLFPGRNLLKGFVKNFAGSLNSKYTRYWEGSGRQWIQRAVHSAPAYLSLTSIEPLITRAYLCECKGFAGFMAVQGGEKLIMATLAGIGARADNGLSEWYRESVPV
ncbi:MAG: urea transporter [Candidatus Obscuribacterales bacterium]|nr:urea transporter [Candidatus Obscuribacterales bacterium]